MPVPVHLAHRAIYHFTHVDNLPLIAQHGLLSTSQLEHLGISHMNVAYTGIQERRASMNVPCGPGGNVHDYVPFYFCKRSPMLHAVVNNKIADEQLLVYFECPITVMDTAPSVFTSHAANAAQPPRFSSNTDDLANLDWTKIDTWSWSSRHDPPGSSLTVRQQKMAEALLHQRVTSQHISRITVWNESVRQHVYNTFASADVDCPPVVIGGKQYYYLSRSTDQLPPVTGPYFIRQAYNNTVKAVHEGLGTHPQARFRSLDELLVALREDMRNLPETAELLGLESDNEMHSEDVGRHTLRVVEELRRTAEFSQMSAIDKLTTEVSAFLHDIGKGPKSRWIGTGGRQQVDPDHPVKGLPMVQRILIKEIRTASPKTARNICKLVCYHDLVGDIVVKGRRVEELEEVARTERQLNMLIAIAKADMRSVNPSWEVRNFEKINGIRERVRTTIKSAGADEE